MKNEWRQCNQYWIAKEALPLRSEIFDFRNCSLCYAYEVVFITRTFAAHFNYIEFELDCEM